MSKTPLYKIVYNIIRKDILSGKIASGDQLPSESRLSEEHNVSIITVRRAIHELVLDGLVESRQGVGTFVKDAENSAVVVGMSSFTSDIASGRLHLVRTLLEDTMEKCPAIIAEKLNIQPNSLVRKLVRLDAEGSRPISIDTARIPAYLSNGIDTQVASSLLFMHLWQMSSGLSFERTNYNIKTEKASPEDQRLLDIGSDIPILCTFETVYDRNAKPCTHITTRYRGDRCRLTGNVMLVQNETPRGRVGE